MGAVAQCVSFVRVDRVCIDSDDMDETVGEIAKMPTYITDSALVLVAAAGRDLDGIFDDRTDAESLLKIECKLSGPDGTVLQAPIHLRRPCRSADELFSDKVFNRAWLFQELILPKRAVVYRPDQLYWKCYNRACAEGSTFESAPLLQLERKYDDDTRETRRLLEQWYRIVELFATKKLRNPQGQTRGADGCGSAGLHSTGNTISKGHLGYRHLPGPTVVLSAGEGSACHHQKSGSVMDMGVKARASLLQSSLRNQSD